MKKIKNILVATDFSKQSDCAVLFGNELKKKSDGNVTLVHISDVSPVWDLPATNGQARNLLEQFQNEISKSLHDLMQSQIDRCNVDFQKIIKFGNAQQELIDLLKSTLPDLLIIGHRGQTGFFGIGSFAEKMIASSPIPVLVAKNNKAINKISCLIDPSRVSNGAIAYTKDLAGIFNAKTQFLSSIADLSTKSLMPFVMPSYEFSEQEKIQITQNVKSFILKESKHLSDGEIHVEISSLSTEKALTKALVEQKADLAIVSRHNRGALENFFIGSTSRGILNQYEGNIIVLPS